MKYVNDEYFEKPKEYFNLYNYINKNLTKNIDFVQWICEDIVLAILMGDIDMAQFLFEFERRDIELNEKQLKKVVSLITELNNNLKTPFNLGYSPNELKDKMRFLA